MSGSGGNFGSSFKPTPEINCDNLSILINISKPKFDAFNTEELDGIELTMFVENGALIFEYEDHFIGHGSNASITTLIECLEQGYRYKAKILQFEWDSYIKVKVK